jgi:hypothetical protein
MQQFLPLIIELVMLLHKLIVEHLLHLVELVLLHNWWQLMQQFVVDKLCNKE